MAKEEKEALKEIKREVKEAVYMMDQRCPSFAYSRIRSALEKLEEFTNNSEPQKD